MSFNEYMIKELFCLKTCTAKAQSKYSKFRHEGFSLQFHVTFTTAVFGVRMECLEI